MSSMSLLIPYLLVLMAALWLTSLSSFVGSLIICRPAVSNLQTIAADLGYFADRKTADQYQITKKVRVSQIMYETKFGLFIQPIGRL